MITLVLVAGAAYLGFELGRRWTAGRIEKATDAREEVAHQRGRRGTVRLKTIQIKR